MFLYRFCFFFFENEILVLALLESPLFFYNKIFFSRLLKQTNPSQVMFLRMVLLKIISEIFWFSRFLFGKPWLIFRSFCWDSNRPNVFLNFVPECSTCICLIHNGLIGFHNVTYLARRCARRTRKDFLV